MYIFQVIFKKLATSILCLALLICFFTEPAQTHEKASQRKCELLLKPEFADKTGFVTDGVALTPENMHLAYSRGIFPWNINESTGLAGWFFPTLKPKRGVLDFKNFKIGRSTRKVIKNKMGEIYTVSFDKAFKEVIKHTSSVARIVNGESQGTWITDEFIDGFTQLHYQNISHSIEVWRNGKLVGGLHGTFAGNYFSGDSMFFLEPNVSKLAFIALVTHLKDMGHSWLDTQTVSETSGSFGAHELEDSKEFLELMKLNQSRELQFYDEPRNPRKGREFFLKFNSENQPYLEPIE